MLQPDAALLRALLPFPRLIPALRDAFAAGATVPLRHTHHIGEAGQPGAGISLLMPAWDDAGFYGVKIVNIFEGNAAHGLPGLHSTYMLYDARTGAPLAMFDGNEITSRRTAAAAALAADYLARPDARSLLVVGAGRVGSLVAPAMAAVRQLERIAIWNRDTAAAARCAQAWRDQGLPAAVADDLEAAVREADIVSCATLATTPIIRGEWLAAGSHLDLIGSFTPRMTEADPACFANASVWVDTDEAPAKAGDLINAFAAGCLSPEALRGNLTDLARGTRGGRESADERTVFKGVGTALEDLASARLAYQQLTASPR
ncbi:ornithine cyclodeaminase family protein [Cupriavidus plantarum]|uniref:ornithine cyclodeaminase family protein n=1 Tax=Cupriavidus plantarum TaxID=942865 RepID=UPI000E23EA03|nr:ornithine cyclodeaminase family protein [Cupriavidus plantarum]REE87633.1 ornithine cyclodeaminase [Cupriavidus plantarum]